MDVYKKETDYIVSSELIDVCYNVLEVLRDAISELTNASKEFFINVLLFSAELPTLLLWGTLTEAGMVFSPS